MKEVRVENGWLILGSIIVYFILGGWLYNIMQSSMAEDRTPSNPITSRDQTMIGGLSAIILLILGLPFLYLATILF